MIVAVLKTCGLKYCIRKMMFMGSVGKQWGRGGEMHMRIPFVVPLQIVAALALDSKFHEMLVLLFLRLGVVMCVLVWMPR